MTVQEIQDKVSHHRTKLAYYQSMLEKAVEGMIHCSGCGTYLNPDQVMVGSFTELVKGECVFRDCGYGDDDEFADVTYSHMVKRCPKCGHELERMSTAIKTENRRNRWGSK